jgi:hypothetical protein
MLATILAFAFAAAVAPTSAAAGDKCVDINFQYSDGHSDVGIFCQGNDITSGIHVNSLHVSCSDKFEGGVGQKSDLAGHTIVSWSIKKLDKDGEVDKVCGTETCPPLSLTAHGDGSILVQFSALAKKGNLYRSEDGDDWEKIAKLPQGATTYLDANTTAGVSYAYSLDKYGKCPKEIVSIPVLPTFLSAVLAVAGAGVAFLAIARRR